MTEVFSYLRQHNTDKYQENTKTAFPSEHILKNHDADDECRDAGQCYGEEPHNREIFRLRIRGQKKVLMHDDERYQYQKRDPVFPGKHNHRTLNQGAENHEQDWK
jgi:hypothetical protein